MAWNNSRTHRLTCRGIVNSPHPMTHDRPIDEQPNEPVTLYRVMQRMIGEGLREHYKPPQKLSHELFVLLMQLKEQERREAAAAASARSSHG
jgi:hypothetical protein